MRADPSTGRVRLAYQYPDTHGPEGDMLDSGDVAVLARAAEVAGWDGFSFTEHPAPGARWLAAGGHQSLDPFVALGHVAAVTSRLRLITYLAVLPYRNPLLLAKSAATVDKLSQGRLTLGIGAGYLKSEFFALGVDFEERNALLDEALTVLPLHWSGEPFSYEGRHFDARQVVALPRPAQHPIPIWIGGNSGLTLRRVAERAQGWMPLMGPPELSATTRTRPLSSAEDLRARVDELQHLAGSRAPGLDVLVGYPDGSIARPEVETDRHREALAALQRAGATWIALSGPSGSLERSLEFIEAVPKLFA